MEMEIHIFASKNWLRHREPDYVRLSLFFFCEYLKIFAYHYPTA